MLSLEEIIVNSKDTREVKRALAVKMVMSGISVKEIEAILLVSDSFISKWKLSYETEGAGSLLLKYQGKKSYLDECSREELVQFIQTKTTFSVAELRDYLEANYQVVYKSKESYYQLLKEAGLSWKRSETVNPKRDEKQVEPQRPELQNSLEARRDEIESGKCFEAR